MQSVQTSRQYPAVDIAKLFCAVLIVMIHVPPFGSANATPLAQTGNFFTRFYLGRIAVPFFFISAGFFLFRKTDPRNYDPAPCRRYVLRILRLYGIWTVLYLPWIVRDARAVRVDGHAAAGFRVRQGSAGAAEDLEIVVVAALQTQRLVVRIQVPGDGLGHPEVHGGVCYRTLLAGGDVFRVVRAEVPGGHG